MTRAMKNPMGAMQQRMLGDMQRRNPQLFQQISQMINGKSEDQLRQMAQNIASDRGVDINSFAQNMGVKL